MQMNNKVIKQLNIAKKGDLSAYFNYWDSKADEKNFQKFISMTNTFTRHIMHLDYYDALLKGHRIFMSDKDFLCITILAEETFYNYSELKPIILDLVDRVREVFEAYMHSRTDKSLSSAFLKDQVELEIARTFPVMWNPPVFDAQILTDVAKIRVLTVLADQDVYTLEEIDKHLHFGPETLKERLINLTKIGLIQSERMVSEKGLSMGYAISEMGKLVLDSLDTGFPGLWVQDSSKSLS